MVKNFDEIFDKVGINKFPIIIAVAGGSASGKTTEVAWLLKTNFIDKGYSCEILSQDNFQIGKKLIKKFEQNPAITEEDKKLEAKIKKYKWDFPDNFNLNFCKEKLLEIQNGAEIIQIPNFDIKNSDVNMASSFKVPQIVIWEGIYSFYGVLNDFNFDFRIFVDSDFVSRILKIYFRSFKQFETKKVDSVIRNIFVPVTNAYNDFVVRQKEKADEVIFNEYDFLETIKRFELSPIGDVAIELENVDLEIPFQDGGRIYLYKKENVYYFAIKFQELFYENIQISKDIYLEILDSKNNFF